MITHVLRGADNNLSTLPLAATQTAAQSQRLHVVPELKLAQSGWETGVP